VFSVIYKTVLYIIQVNIISKGIILEIFAVQHNVQKSDFEIATESLLYFEIKFVSG
jgi:hypothetical protein